MKTAIALACMVALAALASACTPSASGTLPGVVEAEPVRVSAPAAGRLVELSAIRGSTVAAGAPLFRIEAPEDSATLAEAEARVAQQQAQQADLGKGKRPDELAVTAAQTTQARSALREAEAQLRRERELALQGFVSGTRIDSLNAQRDEAAARVRELEAQQRVGQLAGRDDARNAASAAVLASVAQANQLRLRLADKTVRAPVAATVDDTLFRVGEWVAAGTPVVNLLPPAALKVRFFVAESVLPRLKPGDAVSVRCDGCAAPIEARIRSIAQSAEFTPPVIYSREQRARLVYLVEAWPNAADAAKLRAGQPVDVSLAGTGS
ncbi:MAG: HlyD family efflux transporter periplasmic adaptor subunit [Burkholderiaceae bacterium]